MGMPVYRQAGRLINNDAGIVSAVFSTQLIQVNYWQDGIGYWCSSGSDI